MNIFEQASRIGLRFESEKGMLSTDDLWHLPLMSGRGASLDGLAIQTNARLKASVAESFVTTKPAGDSIEELRLEILKHIIQVKLEERQKAAVAKAKADEKAKILDILARKRDQSLEAASEEELLAKLSSLEVGE